jgi:glycosyltransferase involved in cell wall biosynthesis
MHVPQGTGYAIAPLERLFAGVLAELGGVGAEGVHFAYPVLAEGGDPLRTTSGPVIRFSAGNATPAENDELIAYVKRERIEFVLVFDLQATHALYPRLREAGVRAIVSYWGAPISPRNHGWRLLAKRAQFFLSRAKVDGLIFESRAMASLATHGRGVPASRIRVVPLGVDTDRFRPGVSTYAHQTLGIPTDQTLVVYSGHMEPRKGVDVLVRAAVQLLADENRRDVTFLFFGNRGDEADVFRPLYVGRGIDSHIHFGGYRSDLPAIFPCCAMGVIPSSGWDSFPRTAVEFAACGIPLIVSDLGGLPETIEDGRTGLIFPPGDDRQLATHLRRLLDGRSEAREMGAQGRQRCESDFSLTAQRAAIMRALGGYADAAR